MVIGMTRRRYGLTRFSKALFVGRCSLFEIDAMPANEQRATHYKPANRQLSSVNYTLLPDFLPVLQGDVHPEAAQLDLSETNTGQR